MSTPASLFPPSHGARPVLIHDGHVLDAWLSLAYQGVQTGDKLLVVERQFILEPSMRITTFEVKTQSILFEVLKIKDSHYHPLETSRDGESVCKKVLDNVDIDPWDEFLPPPDETVIARPRLGTTPLPPLLEDESGDEDDSLDEPRRLTFGSVEEAGKFFSKNPWWGWAW
jgi:hypothetical protein